MTPNNSKRSTLIVAATQQEINTLQKNLCSSTVTYLTTGIGIHNTIYALTSHLATNSYDLIINVGIAGAFDIDIPLGTTCIVQQDTLIELGIDDNGIFKRFEEEGIPLTNTWTCPYTHLIPKLPTFRSVTVQTVTGSIQQRETLQSRTKADIETMEGAAFFFVCNKKQVPFLQIRSISNHVEPRNKKNWDIPLALKNLEKELIEWFS